MSESPLSIAREGAVATLTLNRPAAGNAIDLDLAKALMEASVIYDAETASAALC